jgi:hypothetical protein
MSDLQCAATVVLVPRESLVHAGWATEALAGVFVAASSATELPAVQRIAHAASCRVEVLAAAIDVQTLRAAIDDLSDLHRGETLAVVATDDEIASLLGAASLPSERMTERLAPPPAASGGRPVSRVITVAIDSSGWSLVPPRTVGTRTP